SDPYVGQTNINSYHACYGTSSDWPSGPNNGNGNMQNADGSGSTGMFAVWGSYGVRHALDGTSSTLLFAAALLGDSKGNENNTTLPRSQNTSSPGSRYRGNGVVIASAKFEVDDFTSSPANVQGIMNSLSACAAAFNSPASTNITSHRGYRWASFSEG